VHIPDLVDDIAYRERDPLRMRSVELGGVRTWLGMPMLRDGNLIGTIAIYRKEVRPFEPRALRAAGECLVAHRRPVAEVDDRLVDGLDVGEDVSNGGRGDATPLMTSFSVPSPPAAIM